MKNIIGTLLLVLVTTSITSTVFASGKGANDFRARFRESLKQGSVTPVVKANEISAGLRFWQADGAASPAAVAAYQYSTVLSLGILVAYSSQTVQTQAGPIQATATSRAISPMAFASGHLPFALLPDLDLSLSLGVGSTWTSSRTSFNIDIGQTPPTSESQAFFLAGTLNARYFFNPAFAVVAQAGAGGLGRLALGVDARF
jgi:hypothetical protein